MSISKYFVIAATAALMPFSAVCAQEQSDPPAPEFKQYVREGVIDPSLAGLAKELSEQAKVIADLKEDIAYSISTSSDNRALEARIKRLEEKVSRIIKILKLQKRGGKIMPRIDINVQPVHMTVTFEQLVQMRAAMQTQINRLTDRIASNACTKDERDRLIHKCELLTAALNAIPDPNEYVPF